MIEPFNFERAEALRMLGILSNEQLLRMAKDAIVRGCIDLNVVRMSMCELDDVEELNAQFEKIKSNRRSPPMNMIDALRLYAKEISASILSGAISPRDGSNLLWRAQINSEIETYHELDGFIYAASEMDDRPEDKKLFEDGILNEAKRVIDTFK